jgi:hypothetical protein
MYGWWNLTDNVSAINLSNQGQFNIPMVDVSLGAPVAYQHDTTRGGPPGAALFNSNDASGLSALDPSGYFITNPFTIGLWVRLDDKTTVNGSILTYADSGGIPPVGTPAVRYRLRHRGGSIDRFEWICVGASGPTTVWAESFGPITLGVWHWIELSYNLDTTVAAIRVTAQRTAAGEPLLVSADYAAVPGAILENPGQLTLGYPGGVNFAFNGAAAGLGLWNRALSPCERGLINAPTDYPFTTEAARFTEDGGARFTEDGQVRISE